ncbi:MAG: hypothetical protein FWG35_01060 [Spirochaetaceae bacterium]|nr:hypothetical protein [Spirochaetaceae bacterium]
MKTSLKTFAAAALVLACASCAARQEITLSAGGGGTARLEAALHPAFMRYYTDLAAGFSASPPPGFFNQEAIREGFRRNSELDLTKMTVTEKGKLTLEFRIKDISAALKNENPAAGNIVRRASSGGRETLSIRLDRGNLASLLAVIPEMDTPAAKMLLPPAAMGEEEYREHLAWALEDYAKDQDVLGGAVIDLVLRTPSKIIAQTGGVLKGEREVSLAIPLPRLFTLEKPIELSVTY